MSAYSIFIQEQGLLLKRSLFSLIGSVALIVAAVIWVGQLGLESGIFTFFIALKVSGSLVVLTTTATMATIRPMVRRF